MLSSGEPWSNCRTLNDRSSSGLTLDRDRRAARAAHGLQPDGETAHPAADHGPLRDPAAGPAAGHHRVAGHRALQVDDRGRRDRSDDPDHHQHDDRGAGG